MRQPVPYRFVLSLNHGHCFSIHSLVISGAESGMGEPEVYGGVEGGGTHSTLMIFDKVTYFSKTTCLIFISRKGRS